MAHSNLPANISHTVLVHAGSYKNFLTQLSKYPQLKPKFVKRVAIHYYIVQLEDSGEKGVTKQEIYSLPIMAMREEFSSYIFFKNIRSYNNVYGLMYTGLFKGTTFLLQRTEPNRYRLVVSDGSPLCSFYIIDDIEKFLDVIGVEVLDLENAEDIRAALEETLIVPNTGIIIVDNDEVFVYEHENY